MIKVPISCWRTLTGAGIVHWHICLVFCIDQILGLLCANELQASSSLWLW